MDDSGQTQLADGTTRIQFVPTHQQLTKIADDMAGLVDTYSHNAPEIDANLGSDRFRRRARELELDIEQLRLIAAKLEREPDPGVLADRIYNWLKDWVTATFAGKDMTKSGPFLTPGFVHNAILDILTDQYRHLDSVQREAITDMTAQVMVARGNDNVTLLTGTGPARALMVREGWSIAQMLEYCGFDEGNLRQRLDFDPDTGGDWYTDDDDEAESE
tara:strand:+ start:158148 stop:158798 length:651 start_codon:yes stop_codon:yes gene_type:complete